LRLRDVGLIIFPNPNNFISCNFDGFLCFWICHRILLIYQKLKVLFFNEFWRDILRKLQQSEIRLFDKTQSDFAFTHFYDKKLILKNEKIYKKKTLSKEKKSKHMALNFIDALYYV